MNGRSVALHQLTAPLDVQATRSRFRRGRVEAGRSPVLIPKLTYVICTNPRSGSWLLSEGLASTSISGNPREWFNEITEQHHRARWRMEHSSDLSYPAYLALARAASTTSNGVSGTKLHYYQFANLMKKLATFESLSGLSPGEVMAKLFPAARYIWLTRRDKARQAISYVIASETDTWWKIDGVAERTLAQPPAFDAEAVARVEQRFREKDRQWWAYFHSNDVDPLVLHYEDLVADFTGTIRKALSWLGIPDADEVAIAPPRLRRQSSGLNEQWLERYLEFQREGPRPGPAEDSHVTGDPASDERGRRRDTIPPVWKRWVGHAKALGESDDAVVEVLERNGYARPVALEEARQAASDPYLAGAVKAHQTRRKAIALLSAQGQLARLRSPASTVERRAALSRDEFRDTYYAANRPVVMSGLMDEWRAMTRWTPAYLKQMAGDAVVEVMTGRSGDPRYELNGAQHRTEMRFGEYVDMVYSGARTNDYYMVANNRFFQRPESTPLRADFTPFPHYLRSDPARRQCFLWFGPAGTITPLHHDTSNILIAQVAGRKHVRLVPASQWQYVYNTTGVFSDVDAARPDFSHHPLFRYATVSDIVLEPGEVLFMPVGWWHHVTALDISMTLSFTNFVFPNHFNWE